MGRYGIFDRMGLMIGLAYLGALFLYLFVLWWAMRAAWRVGKSKSTACAWVYASVAFLALYLPFFWEDIPTLIAHKVYCAKDGGIRIYVAPETWLAAHRDELDRLRVQQGGEPVGEQLPLGWKRDYLLNKRVAVETRERVLHYFSTSVRQRAERFVDTRDGIVLVEYMRYGIGRPLYRGGIKFWLYRPNCDQADYVRFGEIRRALSLFGK